MTDLARLIEWNENQAPRCWYSGDSDNHRETARILRALADVQRECYTDRVKDTMDIHSGERNPAIRVTGPVETLRRLAELLEKAK